MRDNKKTKEMIIMNLNQINLTGNLTKDWKLEHSQNGEAYAKSTLAVNYQKDKTLFVNLVAFGKMAENLVKHTKKGNKLLVQGYLEIQNYEKDGVQKSWTNVIIQNVEFLSPKNVEENQQETKKAEKKAKAAPKQEEDEMDVTDDFPF